MHNILYIYIYIYSNIGGLDRVDDVNLARAIISIMSWIPSTLPLLPMVLVVNLRSECDDEDHPSKYFSCKLKVKKKRHLFPIVMYKRKLIQSINTGSNKNIFRKMVNKIFARSLFWFCVVCLYALFRRHFHMNPISSK